VETSGGAGTGEETDQMISSAEPLHSQDILKASAKTRNVTFAL